MVTLQALLQKDAKDILSNPLLKKNPMYLGKWMDGHKTSHSFLWVARLWVLFFLLCFSPSLYISCCFSYHSSIFM